MRPHGKYASVDPNNPEAFGQCGRCSFWYNLRALSWQLEWAGQRIYSKQILVCERCYDRPDEQLRTIILPPDPPPLPNARVPDFAYEQQTVLIAQFHNTGQQPAPNSQPPWGSGPGLILCDQSGEVPLLAQYLTSS